VEPSSCMIDTTCRCDTTWKNFLVWNHLLNLSIKTISWTFAIFMSTTYMISLVSWSRHHLWIIDEILGSRYHLKQTNWIFICIVVLSLYSYHYYELLWLTWTKLICLSFQVQFEPSLSFFTLIWRLSYQGCTCHLFAIQIKSSTWVH
jgi:hypothetical protein